MSSEVLEEQTDSMEVGFTWIEPGEAIVLIPNGQRLQIISGTGWVTMGFEDIILYKSQTVILNDVGFRVVVSPLGAEPLVVSVME